MLRAYREELILAGALTRVGREIVVFGEPYSRWMQKRSIEVPGFAKGSAVHKERAHRVRRVPKSDKVI